MHEPLKLLLQGELLYLMVHNTEIFKIKNIKDMYGKVDDILQ